MADGYPVHNYGTDPLGQNGSGDDEILDGLG